jgi:hypothetical protein
MSQTHGGRDSDFVAAVETGGEAGGGTGGSARQRGSVVASDGGLAPAVGGGGARRWWRWPSRAWGRRRRDGSGHRRGILRRR